MNLGRNRYRVSGALLLLLLLPRFAYANGAMSLALSIFAWPLWLVYVAAMVFFEAGWIGRALGMPFRDALTKSLVANAVTLVLGAIFSGIFGYMLYGCFGSNLNPNPLGQSVLLLILGGLFSAAIEAPFWKNWHGRSPWRASFAAHLLGVPLALVILLLPARPYPGLEGQASWRRHWVFPRSMERALSEELSERERFPESRTFPELLERLRPKLQGYENATDLWAAAYRPRYHRFDTGERRREPIEWNATLAGKRSDAFPELVWVIRWRYPISSTGEFYSEGLIYDSRLQSFARSTDAKKLGF